MNHTSPKLYTLSFIFVPPYWTMPAKRARRYICDDPNCTSAFIAADHLRQHKLIHAPYEQRPYACEFTRCGIRTITPLALKIHVNNIHYKIRVPCKLGCGETFCNPAAECTHRKRFHPTLAASNASENTARRSDAQEIFTPHSFNTSIAAIPSSHHDPTESYYATSPSASSSSVYTRQSIPLDEQIKSSHQEAYNANQRDAAQSAWGHAPDAHTQGVQTSNPLQLHPGIGQGVAQTDQSCRWDPGVGDPLPLRGQEHVVQSQGEIRRENFIIPRSGHVPSYDKSRRMPYSSSLPPNPGMLF